MAVKEHHRKRTRTILILACCALVTFVVWLLLASRKRDASGRGPDTAARPRPHVAATTLEEIAVHAIATAPSATAVFARACALCHGPRGEGNEELRTPSIAGQPKWYLSMQLRKFRNGQRGAHPRDQAGKQMAIVARALPAENLDAIVATIGAMDPIPTKRTLTGDVENGELVYAEECMECHRYNGQGELAFQSGPLTSFQDWYLANELEEFRVGIRGQDPLDVAGGKMRAVARYIDAKARRDVIAYIATLAARYPPIK